MMTTATTDAEFFEAKYRDNIDPWAFASSQYEQHRYSMTLRALDHRRYKRAFEPGCSIGILTARLALICDRVDSIDFSQTAIDQARRFCEAFQNVHLNCGSLPADIPSGTFDLIVLSEIGYYFNRQALMEIGTQLVERLQPSGVLLGVHWLGRSADHLLDGDQVHEILGQLNGLKLEHSERYTGFRIDRWIRT
jgi:SAM-dependent methyltransferase